MREKNRKWWVLGAMATSISMIFVDVTVLPVVLPTLQRELGISDLGLQWVINAYTLILAMFVLAGGRIGDMWGLKKAFCFGLLFFAFASALCGLSTSEWWMIGSRALQGIGGAFLIPAAQGIIFSHFPPHQRGKALGLFVSIGSIFLALGPLIGGSLTTYLSWHYVFWINLPIALIGLWLTLSVVPAMKGKKEKFDWRGFGILTVGIFSLVLPLMQAQAWGWTSDLTLGLFLIGLFSLYFLFKRRKKSHASIIDFNLISTKASIASLTCISTNQFLVMVTVFWAIYFQNILGFSASQAGLLSFLANAPILFAAPFGGFLVDRFGPRLPVMIGFSLIFFSLLWWLKFDRVKSVWLLLPALIPFGFGIPMVFTPSFVALMNQIPSEKRGVASGINSTLRQFSATMGLAVFGSIFSSIHFGKFSEYLKTNAQTASLIPAHFEGLLSHSLEAVKNTQALPSAESDYVFTAARESFLNGFTHINAYAAMAACIGIFIAWRLLKNQPLHTEK